ncbi:MAG: hypothetical protein H6835_16435, partial [Planctomycetes bacterium]|nr:hypothetical protein [Planctomycetota bacterium]
MVRPAVPLPVSIVFAMLGCGLAAPFARAQEVTVSAAATTPIRVWTWTYWGTLLSSTQPAGPLPTSGAVSNIVFGAKAAVAWELPDATSFDLTFDCGAQGGSTSQFGVDAFGLVLDLAAPSSRAVVLEFSRVDTVTG